MWWIPRGFCILESKSLKVSCNVLGLEAFLTFRCWILLWPWLRSHYGSKAPAVTITVFKYRNKIGKIVVKTVPYSVNVNVKNVFTSHIDKQISLTFFLTSLSLYIFIIWKCIAYNRFCRDGIYFDKILVSEYIEAVPSNNMLDM